MKRTLLVLLTAVTLPIYATELVKVKDLDGKNKTGAASIFISGTAWNTAQIQLRGTTDVHDNMSYCTIDLNANNYTYESAKIDSGEIWHEYSYQEQAKPGTTNEACALRLTTGPNKDVGIMGTLRIQGCKKYCGVLGNVATLDGVYKLAK